MPNWTFQTEPEFRVVKDTVPYLEVRVKTDFDGIRGEYSFVITSWNVDARIRGIPFPVSNLWDQQIQFQVNGSKAWWECSFRVLLYPELVRMLERNRDNDVDLEALFQVRWAEFPGPGGNVDLSRRLIPGTSARPIRRSFSQVEWLKLLESVGYDGGWVFELSRPAMPAWGEVARHLGAAQKSLLSHDERGTIQHCRDALLAVSPQALEQLRTEAKREREAGGVALGKFPPKSERVVSVCGDLDKLMEDLLFLTDTGAHGEAHRVSMLDASLAFYQTFALLSYLSQVPRRQ